MSRYSGNDNTNAGAGVSFFGLLAIVFIVLKLTDYINWSWVWVLAPLWMPIAFIIILAVIIVAVEKYKEWK